MTDVNYLPVFVAFRERDNYAEVFRSTLEDLASKVDLSHVKSCVAFGTSSGEGEMEFARRLLPNLRSFTAVEKDPESIEALRTNFQNGLLPGVETSVVETSLQSWSGVDNQADVVLLFNVLSPIQPTDRKALFQKLMTQCLNSGGLVIIVNNVTSVPSGYVLLMNRLGAERVGFDELEEEVLAAGFRVVLKQDFAVTRDLSNPSDDLVKYIEMTTNHKFSESEVRTAIDDIFSQPAMNVSPNRLAIFKK